MYLIADKDHAGSVDAKLAVSRIDGLRHEWNPRAHDGIKGPAELIFLTLPDLPAEHHHVYVRHGR